MCSAPTVDTRPCPLTLGLLPGLLEGFCILELWDGWGLAENERQEETN